MQPAFEKTSRSSSPWTVLDEEGEDTLKFFSNLDTDLIDFDQNSEGESFSFYHQNKQLSRTQSCFINTGVTGTYLMKEESSSTDLLSHFSPYGIGPELSQVQHRHDRSFLKEPLQEKKTIILDRDINSPPAIQKEDGGFSECSQDAWLHILFKEIGYATLGIRKAAPIFFSHLIVLSIGFLFGKICSKKIIIHRK